MVEGVLPNLRQAARSQPVLVVGEIVYSISNTNRALDFVGDKVKVTGKLEKETLTIDSIVRVPPSTKQ